MKNEQPIGCPSISNTDEKNWRAMALVRGSETIDEVVCFLQISHGYAYEIQILHSQFRFLIVCVIRVPREHIEVRMAIVSKSVGAQSNAATFDWSLFGDSSHQSYDLSSLLWLRIQKADYGLELS